MPQWRQGLTKSLHHTRSMPESRYFQLATVDDKGLPFCRTVVYRGLTEDNQLIIISDTRSEKFKQLQDNGHAHVCWYFAKSREQYRFGCKATLVTWDNDSELLAFHWRKLSDAGKKQFLWGEPGTPRNDGSALHVEGSFEKVPPHFCVILLTIETVDYLSLRGNPQYREWHQKDAMGNWISQSVIP